MSINIKKQDAKIWWNIYNTLSYNALFNFIIGNRGGGKTFGFKKWAINDFIKNENQFIYVRRFKKEFANIKTFFADIEHMYPEHDFEVKNTEFLIDGKVAGFALPLSTSKIQKSTSFPKVTKIAFDEFLLDKGVYHYLQDEVTCFLELYETIARMRDNVTCFFMANAISMINPYFLYFNIRVPKNFSIYRVSPEIIVELVNNDDFIKQKSETRFASIVKNTPYFDYAVLNEFLRDDDTFIEPKTRESQYYFTFTYEDAEYGVWIDYKAGAIFVTHETDPYCLVNYAFTTKDHKPNTLFFKSKYRGAYFDNFVKQYQIGNVRFENLKIKNICYQIMRGALS